MTESGLSELFGKHGKVHGLRMAKDLFAGTCKGFAELKMEGHEAREAMAALEAEAQEKAQEAKKQTHTPKGDGKGDGAPPVAPEDKAQRNFTDPDSRIMKDSATKSFAQCYNCQAAVDGEEQVIVAATLTQQGTRPSIACTAL